GVPGAPDAWLPLPAGAADAGPQGAANAAPAASREPSAVRRLCPGVSPARGHRAAGRTGAALQWAAAAGADRGRWSVSEGAESARLPSSFMRSDPLIAVEHVSREVTDSTGTLTILHDIDVALPARQSTAIVGASGSGKSTLLAIIAGLDRPTRGTVRLDGVDLFALDEDARAAVRAQRLGFVFQSFQLLGHLSALENVMLPLELLGRGDARARATEMLGRVGLGARLHHHPRTLSGGEQQRVALARAFVVEPQVLLADEPTGSLDHATGETVMALMFEMNREAGTTLLLVTHDRGIAARCDRQLHIEAGRLKPAA
ncbi:MAG: hypothetical protein RL223_3964, partial [Pseudomonadota bacterium]